jgi:TPP-dependent pyruvate/acetoin dehydrogenase alpha subunit
MAVNTVRLSGHYVGDPQVYRPKDEARDLRETQDPLTLLRERLDVSDEEWDELDREATEIADESVDFAQNGTDPAPEAALENVYA